MSTVTLDMPRDKAEVVVKAAFEQMNAIGKYAVDGRYVIGATGLRLTSNGERVVVELDERDGRTDCIVEGEAAISGNITASPEQFQRKCVNQIEELRELPFEKSQAIVAESSSEVRSEKKLGSSVLQIFAIVITVILLNIGFMFVIIFF
jgi:hypothetical protein